MKSKQSYLNNWNFLALIWLGLNIIQAYFTVLLDDEAYYWEYSRQLAWGYFDHPPMVGVFIKAGYTLFQNELGVRLLTAFAQLAMLRIIWELIEVNNKKAFTWLFFMLAFSLPMVQIYGFITTPDVPLLLFGSLTLLAYRNFERTANFTNILVFALAAAALMYSKYHGALLLIFIIASNLKLLLQPKFYLVGILAIALFSPHIYWQYSHEFPSFQYHLTDRVVQTNWLFIPEYVINNFLVYNPMLWFVFIPVIRKSTSFLSTDAFKRTLLFILFGFLGFFFLISLQMRHIEPQWTVLIIIPLIILTFEQAVSAPLLIKKIKKMGWISLAFIAVIRLNLVLSILPLGNFHHADVEKIVKEVEVITQDYPVIHDHSYQKAALHAFYSQKQFSYSYNSINGWRSNQYSIWDLGDEYNGQSVIFAHIGRVKMLHAKKALLSNGDTLFYKIDSNFVNIQQVKIEIEPALPPQLIIDDTIPIKINIHNPYDYDISMEGKKVALTLSEGRTKIYNFFINQKNTPTVLKARSTTSYSTDFVVLNYEGKWNLNWSIKRGVNPPLYNGQFSKVEFIKRTIDNKENID